VKSDKHSLINKDQQNQVIELKWLMNFSKEQTV